MLVNGKRVRNRIGRRENRTLRRLIKSSVLRGERYLRRIFTANDILEDTAIGGKQAESMSRDFPLLLENPQDEVPRLRLRRSVSQIIVSRVSPGKWNFGEKDGQRREKEKERVLFFALQLRRLAPAKTISPGRVARELVTERVINL